MKIHNLSYKTAIILCYNPEPINCVYFLIKDKKTFYVLFDHSQSKAINYPGFLLFYQQVISFLLQKQRYQVADDKVVNTIE